MELIHLKNLSNTTSKLNDSAPSSSAVNKEMLENILDEEPPFSPEEKRISNMVVEQAIQTDVVPSSLDVAHSEHLQSSRCLSFDPTFFTKGIGCIFSWNLQ